MSEYIIKMITLANQELLYTYVDGDTITICDGYVKLHKIKENEKDKSQVVFICKEKDLFSIELVK
jgi:hypothetical protein